MDALQMIHASLQDLHVKTDDSKDKQDRLHAEMVGFRAELGQQEVRTATLEQTCKEHTELHEGTLLRVAELDKQVKTLQAREASRSRSPTPARASSDRPDVSPPRSPRCERDPEEDLQIVFGGWADARKGDAEGEIREIFRRCGIEERLESVIIPYIRTTFARINLKFPEGCTSIQARRVFQSQMLEKLKAATFLSGVSGSKDRPLWMTRNRSVEERHKIRALVQLKEFYKRVPLAAGRPREDPEIDWRGRLYVGRHQGLAEASKLPSDAHPADVYLEDNRGDHTGWVVLANRFQAITGHPPEQLPEFWEQGYHTPPDRRGS